MKTIQPIDDKTPIRGHTYDCDGCGHPGVCCDTSNGGVVLGGIESQVEIGDDLLPLLAGDAKGGRTDQWLCEDCAGE